MSFESLKSKTSLLDKLNAELSKEGKSGYIDDRLWKPQMGKDDVGSAVIRFLPISDEDAMPWAKVWSHAFKGPGGWYIENSLTTLNQKDPMSEYNTMLWNNGTDSGKDQARKQKRKLTYVANIYVVKDPANPSNEGQVMLYKFGKKIFDKITEAMQPAFEDEQAINPFDFWKGANFKLKIRKVDGYWNYDKSEFEGVTPLKESDDDIKAIWEKQYPLKPFVDPSNFKTYDELKEKLNRVITGTQSTATVDSVDLPPQTTTAVEMPKVSESAPVSDDDDTLSYFSKLADED